VRLLAHYSEDPHLIASFKNEGQSKQHEKHNNNSNNEEHQQQEKRAEDFFESLARKWKNMSASSTQCVSSSDRAAAKELCYAILYGAGDQRVANTLNCSLLEARQHLAAFKQRYI